jgi:Family of unknown function (DUF6519)
MKGDFSRQTSNPAKHYIEVLMQQGRVQIDADWNEQQAINRHLTVTEARDVIGPSGVPLDASGFKIDLTPDSTDLTISSGRIYVDGILCELESTSIPIISFQGKQNVQVAPIWVVDNREFQVGQWVELSATVQSVQVTKEVQITSVAKVTNLNPEYLELTFNTTISEFQNADMQTARIRRITTYITQPDYPNPLFVAQSKLSLDAQTSVALIYLDVWQRHLTWLDDADMREVALGGADTTTRVKTVWQVKIKPIALTSDIQELLAIYQIYITLAQQFAGTPFGPEFLVVAAEIQGIIDKTLVTTYTGNTHLPEWDAITAPDTGTLNAQTQPLESTNNPCLIPPSSGYQLLENQLYRVEVHYGSDIAGGPTFKWSRNNGCVTVKINKISGSTIQVDTLGPDDILGFINADGSLGWAEIVDDTTELGGQPGQLVQITDVQSATNTITVDAALTPIDSSLNPLLRLWDQTGVTATANGIAITNAWQDLEGGIQVQFSQGKYTTDNYWLIPARTATVGGTTGTIEWPQDANLDPVPQPAQGIQHHYCRLSILLKDPFNQSLSVSQDCRRPFPPLAPPAMRILSTNWQNDDFITTEQLFNQGLLVTFDAVPYISTSSQAPTVATPMIVTLEMPLLLLTGAAGGLANVATALLSSLDLNLSINGSITITFSSIQWNWPTIDQATSLQMIQALDEILLAIATNLNRFLYVRVTLQGNTLWSDAGDQRIHLDGQALGKSESTDLRADKKTPRIALVFPSGAGTRASNFESWFYLAPSPLHIASVNFVSTIATAGQTISSSAGTISPPPIPSSTEFKESEKINAIQFTFNRPIDPILQQSVSVQFLPGQSGSLSGAGRISLAKAAEASKSPLEAIRIFGGFASAGSGSPIKLSGGGGGGLPVRVAGSVSLDASNTIATFTVDPNAENEKYKNGFPQGSYSFSVSGTETPVYATVGTNRIRLDGNFDFLPGGDFSMPFNVISGIAGNSGNLGNTIFNRLQQEG